MKKKTGKKIVKYVKLQVPAGNATPSPPVGPILGQHGLKLMDFCKEFNERSQGVEKNMPLPVVISVYEDKSFDFVIKTPPAVALLRKAAGIDKGSAEPNKTKVGKVTRAQLEEIVRLKEPDLNSVDIEAGIRIIAGSARSMGIDVEEAEA